MSYTISLDDAKYLELFDDIPYKYLKDCYANDDIDKNDEELDIEITELPCDRIAYCKTQIVFEIRFIDDIRFGETYYKTLKYSKTFEYSNCGGIALKLGEITENDDESECEITESDDE